MRAAFLVLALFAIYACANTIPVAQGDFALALSSASAGDVLILATGRHQLSGNLITVTGLQITSNNDAVLFCGTYATGLTISASQTTISSVKFEGCNTASIVYTNSQNNNIQNCNFTGKISLQGSQLTINNTYFTSIPTTAVQLQTSQIIGDNIHFNNNQNNQASAYGGAVRLTTRSSFECHSCSFVNNFAEQGGAVYSTNSSLSFYGCNFISNRVPDTKGGAISADGPTIIDSCDFTANSGNTGAAIALENTKEAHITRSRITLNVATSSAISMTHAEVTITDTTISDNSAGSGVGAVLCDASKVSFVSCIFRNNTGLYAGALRIQASSQVTINNSNFIENNSKGSAGGLLIISSQVQIHSSNFLDNNAIINGGGIQINDLSKVIIFDSTISGNTAPSDRAINMYNDNLGRVVIRNTFIDFVNDKYCCNDASICSYPVCSNCIEATGCECSFAFVSNVSYPIEWNSTCTCNQGYEPDGALCVDIDECKNNPDMCPYPNAKCTNFEGGHECACAYGFKGPYPTCTPDCNINNGGCDWRVTCSAEGFTRTCGPCPVGTNGTGDTFCESLCHNGICESFENCVTCPQDCPGPCGLCGDSLCEPSLNETCSSCSEDCKKCTEQPCINGCSGNGRCENGRCICNALWTGPSCSTSSNQPIDITKNNTNPSIMFGQGFGLSILRVAELDKSKTEIRSISIPGLNFTLNETQNGSNTILNYTVELENTASLSVVLYQINEETTITFANITNTFQANTIKMSVNVVNWPFMAIQNSLGIILDNSIDSDCVNSDPDENNDIKWVMISVGDVSLYGQFLEQAVLDGVVRPISFYLNQDSTVTARLPHFWQLAEMDPHYSVLVGDINKEECESALQGNNKKDNLLLVKIIVPIVVGLAVLAAIGIFMYPRLRTRYQLSKKREVDESGTSLGQQNKSSPPANTSSSPLYSNKNDKSNPMYNDSA